MNALKIVSVAQVKHIVLNAMPVTICITIYVMLNVPKAVIYQIILVSNAGHAIANANHVRRFQQIAKYARMNTIFMTTVAMKNVPQVHLHQLIAIFAKNAIVNVLNVRVNLQIANHVHLLITIITITAMKTALMEVICQMTKGKNAKLAIIVVKHASINRLLALHVIQMIISSIINAILVAVLMVLIYLILQIRFARNAMIDAKHAIHRSAVLNAKRTIISMTIIATKSAQNQHMHLTKNAKIVLLDA